jgi:hypothetical protein
MFFLPISGWATAHPVDSPLDGGTKAIDLTGAGGVAERGRILLLVRVVGGLGGTGDGSSAEDRN